MHFLTLQNKSVHSYYLAGHMLRPRGQPEKTTTATLQEDFNTQIVIWKSSKVQVVLIPSVKPPYDSTMKRPFKIPSHMPLFYFSAKRLYMLYKHLYIGVIISHVILFQTVSNQERVIMARVWYIILIVYCGLLPATVLYHYFW